MSGPDIVVNGYKLSKAQFEALKRFKKNNGRDWKWALSNGWADGYAHCIADEIDRGHLQHIRNDPRRPGDWLKGIRRKELE